MVIRLIHDDKEILHSGQSKSWNDTIVRILGYKYLENTEFFSLDTE